MITIENFEFEDESEKAWKIGKVFRDGCDPDYRWIPKSLSQMNAEKNSIQIKKWFFEQWMKELEKDDENIRKLSEAYKKREVEWENSRNTPVRKEALKFIEENMPDDPTKIGLSKTKTIFYLVEFHKYFNFESEINKETILQIKLQDLLSSDPLYREAKKFIDSKIIPVQMPRTEELSFLMTEFHVKIFVKKYF